MKAKDGLIYAGIAAGVAVLWIFRDGINKLFNFAANPNKGTPYEGGGAVGTLGNLTNSLLGGVPQAIGEKISEWIAPSGVIGDNVYYTVVFPDGARHAVAASMVDKSGYFVRDGRRYRIGVNQANQKVAIAA